ncbi:MAG: hypothetical protein IJ193_00350 [Bacilli bacterium]|nr:hypothetical protein [Bacilli bacterium]
MASVPDQRMMDINNKYSQYTEHVLDIDEFKKPKVYTGPRAVVHKILELIMMKPGTYPTRPYMGVGLVENFRYTFTDKISDLSATINEQIATYLPEFSSVRVELDTSMEHDKRLVIYIIIDSMTYTVALDTDKKTLSWITGEA